MANEWNKYSLLWHLQSLYCQYDLARRHSCTARSSCKCIFPIDLGHMARNLPLGGRLLGFPEAAIANCSFDDLL